MFKKAKELLQKKNLDPDKRDLDLEKGDFAAIMIAAFLSFFPVFLGVIAFFALLSFLFIRIFSGSLPIPNREVKPRHADGTA